MFFFDPSLCLCVCRPPTASRISAENAAGYGFLKGSTWTLCNRSQTANVAFQFWGVCGWQIYIIIIVAYSQRLCWGPLDIHMAPLALLGMSGESCHVEHDSVTGTPPVSCSLESRWKSCVCAYVGVQSQCSSKREFPELFSIFLAFELLWQFSLLFLFFAGIPINFADALVKWKEFWY
jgi:hypothetical protein